MKRRILFFAVVMLALCLLAQAVSLADPSDYADYVESLVKKWDPDATRDSLIALYGAPLYDADTYVSFWDQGLATLRTYYFSEGLLTSVTVRYGRFTLEYWNSAYSMYASARDRVSEILGDRLGVLSFYNGDERAAADVDCLVSSWNNNGMHVLMAYNQTATHVSVETVISSVK